MRGNFKIFKGFELNTDFKFYTRRGYGTPELDTTDPIWNMRLSYTMPGGKWIVMADAFDLLHKLNNVNYAVNAQGRVITWTNTLPRYLMFTVQYRFNKQPKRR